MDMMENSGHCVMLWQSLHNRYGSKYFHPTVPSPDPTPSDGKHLSSARIPPLPWDGRARGVLSIV